MSGMEFRASGPILAEDTTLIRKTTTYLAYIPSLLLVDIGTFLLNSLPTTLLNESWHARANAQRWAWSLKREA